MDHQAHVNNLYDLISKIEFKFKLERVFTKVDIDCDNKVGDLLEILDTINSLNFRNYLSSLNDKSKALIRSVEREYLGKSTKISRKYFIRQQLMICQDFIDFYNKTNDELIKDELHFTCELSESGGQLFYGFDNIDSLNNVFSVFEKIRRTLHDLFDEIYRFENNVSIISNENKSFKLIVAPENFRENTDHFYKKLTVNGFIAEITKPIQIEKLFSNIDVRPKIIWIGYPSDLIWFVKLLTDQPYISKIGKDIWKITSNCFELLDHPEYNFSEHRSLKPTRNETKIKEIIGGVNI